MVCRMLKNELRKKMRSSKPESCAGVVREFLHRSIGNDRKPFWEDEGLSTFSDHYDIDPPTLLDEIVAMDTSDIVDRLKTFFTDENERESDNDNIESLTQYILSPLVRRFPHLDSQEGLTWTELIETPRAFRSLYIHPQDTNPKTKAIQTFERAIGKFVYASQSR